MNVGEGGFPVPIADRSSLGLPRTAENQMPVAQMPAQVANSPLRRRGVYPVIAGLNSTPPIIMETIIIANDHREHLPE